MPTRRSVLATVAALPAALVGCVGNPQEPPRSVVSTVDKEDEIPWRQTTTVERDPPDIEGQEILRGRAGNVVIAAKLHNWEPVGANATLFAHIEHNGTVERYQADFQLASYSRKTVNISVPIDYDSFADAPNLRLSVALRDDTLSSTDSSPST